MNLEEIVLLAKKEDRLACSKLMEFIWPSVMEVCKNLLDECDWDDESQLVFIRFFDSLATFSYTSDKHLENYSKTMTFYHCMTFLKRKTKTKKKLTVCSINGEAHEVIDPEPGFQVTPKQYDMLVNEIRQLALGYRTIFTLRVKEGCSYQRIGELLGITEETSRSQFFHAKKELRRILNIKRFFDGTE